MRKKKSYNPFKLYGSWIGAIIFSFIHLNMGFLGSGNAWEMLPYTPDFSIIIIAIGFIIGWIINAIIIKLRK